MSGVNEFAIAITRAGADSEISPDASLLVEQSSKDLLHKLVFDVKNLSDCEHLVAVLARITQLGDLLLESIRLDFPALKRLNL